MLFISFNSGLKHNALYQNLDLLQESIYQLFEEEKQDTVTVPTFETLENHFKKEKDYFQVLENDTWFHAQELINYMNWAKQ